MHAIAAHQSFATLQIIDKEPLLARWFGEIHEDIVIRTVSPSVAIVSYLRQVLTIHLMIPHFSIHHILKKRFCEPIINRWNEKILTFWLHFLFFHMHASVRVEITE